MHKRTLPWRKAGIGAYEVWVSEVMLQQTQVPRVAEYYERFLKKFPTVKRLARARWRDFLPYWDGLGYYNRGRNMLAAAKIVDEKYGGEFPREKKLLMALPGVGEYTASAIRSFAYGEPEIAFDTNFKKIFGTREKAEAAFRGSGVPSRIFNSAIMDYSSGHPRGSGDPVVVRETLDSRLQGNDKIKEVFVVLHENHQKYFSLNKKKYQPLAMPAGVTTRREIKKYFLEKYKLKVSVRPPQRREIADGTLTLFVNAQILLGRHVFSVYNADDITHAHP